MFTVSGCGAWVISQLSSYTQLTVKNFLYMKSINLFSTKEQQVPIGLKVTLQTNSTFWLDYKLAIPILHYFWIGSQLA